MTVALPAPTSGERILVAILAIDRDQRASTNAIVGRCMLRTRNIIDIRS